MRELFILVLSLIISTLNSFGQISHLNLPDSLLLKKIKLDKTYQTDNGYWNYKSTNGQDVYIFKSNKDDKRKKEIVKHKNEFITLKLYTYNTCENGNCNRDTTKFMLTEFTYEDEKLTTIVKKDYAGEILKSSSINYNLDGSLNSSKTKCSYFFDKNQYTSNYKHEKSLSTETIFRNGEKYAERITNYTGKKKVVSNNIWHNKEYELISKETLILNEKNETKNYSVNYVADKRLWSIIKMDIPIDSSISFD